MVRYRSMSCGALRFTGIIRSPTEGGPRGLVRRALETASRRRSEDGAFHQAGRPGFGWRGITGDRRRGIRGDRPLPAPATGPYAGGGGRHKG